MRARDITNIDAAEPASTSLPVVFSTRVGEMWDLAACLDDPDDVLGLHDLRIAAKRVRYLLEFFEDSFGVAYQPMLQRFKQLQDLLGDVHDCDEWVDYLVSQLKQTHSDSNTSIESLAEFPGASPELRDAISKLSAELKSGPKQGQCLLLTDICDRRQLLFVELREFWASLEQTDFRQEILTAVKLAASESTDSDLEQGESND